MLVVRQMIDSLVRVVDAVLVEMKTVTSCGFVGSLRGRPFQDVLQVRRTIAGRQRRSEGSLSDGEDQKDRFLATEVGKAIIRPLR
ncbi:hypothetical protein MA16_Dca009678 [Dendrobium catenatum]|uniref:Uncharacterized protein n=1 Tax=Dendrobium catenatum TaxID=906689 RepID=A0A2I0VSQ0_9ASPA|nr:hypothetical protein MA16_Dca009678 [Dendrobium catenatum]